MSDTSMTDEVQETDTKAANSKENQKFLAEFIEIYQAYPCLWKYNCRDYRNRNAKERAYRELIDKMREVDPRADKSSVIRKINVLRTAFRREYKKAKKYGVQSKASKSMGKPKKKHETTLWYYDLMKFVIEDQEYPDADIDIDEMNDWMQEGTASLDDDGKIVDHSTESLMEFLEDTTHTEVKIEASSPFSSPVASPVMNPATNAIIGLQLEINDLYSEKNNQSVLPTLRRDEPIISLQEPPPLAPISRPRRQQLPVQPQQVQQPQALQSPQAQTSPCGQQPQTAPQTQQQSQQQQAQQQQAQQQQAQQQQAQQQLQQQQAHQLQAHSLQHIQLHQVEVEHADFDRFGTYVAAKLKRSTRKQSIIAEKVIAEVLMRANLGTLEESTRLTDSKV